MVYIFVGTSEVETMNVLAETLIVATDERTYVALTVDTNTGDPAVITGLAIALQTVNLLVCLHMALILL